MKHLLTPFGVFKNQIIGEEVRAIDFQDLLNNRMTNKQKEFWSNVMFKDCEGRTIQITREFFDEQLMSESEIVADWIEHGDTEAEITVLKKNGSGTKNLQS